MSPLVRPRRLGGCVPEREISFSSDLQENQPTVYVSYPSWNHPYCLSETEWSRRGIWTVEAIADHDVINDWVKLGVKIMHRSRCKFVVDVKLTTERCISEPSIPQHRKHNLAPYFHRFCTVAKGLESPLTVGVSPEWPSKPTVRGDNFELWEGLSWDSSYWLIKETWLRSFPQTRDTLIEPFLWSRQWIKRELWVMIV